MEIFPGDLFVQVCLIAIHLSDGRTGSLTRVERILFQVSLGLFPDLPGHDWPGPGGFQTFYIWRSEGRISGVGLPCRILPGLADHTNWWAGISFISQTVQYSTVQYSSHCTAH